MSATVDAMRQAAVTNVRVGEEIGLAHSTVSRIRSGERLPSIEVMDKIAAAYNWSLDAQVLARKRNIYAEAFETALCERFGIANEVYAV